MSSQLVMKFQTDTDISSWEIGHKILSCVFEEQKIKPERIATFGEVTARKGINIETIEECREHWGAKAIYHQNGKPVEFFAGFNWKRGKSVKSEGHIDFPDPDFASEKRGAKYLGDCSFYSSYRKEINWLGFFRNWSQLTGSQTGILHPDVKLDGISSLTKDIRDYTFQEDVAQQSWSRFLGGNLHAKFTAGDLNSKISGLTNLGWATWFGRDFADEIDEAKISAAGFFIEKIGDGYLLRVTDNIHDVVKNFAMFSERRGELKALFRDDLFLIKDEPIKIIP